MPEPTRESHGPPLVAALGEHDRVHIVSDDGYGVCGAAITGLTRFPFFAAKPLKRCVMCEQEELG